ncbi:MAG TPA: 2-dehydropantoate 2-reductase [Burkholderiaceae bacterium]|jgi:2-dehydropantoate 2-reductase|nr:2-dehydropantoate 2-reductase [Burkholderiaceae bacterium]HRZ59061.1 2-dehydropantoate 2-reductase [Rubrivivax sp.]
MRVCVVGAGGIGATLGARLALAGHEVGLVARGAHLAALQEQGLRFVDEAAGAEHRLRLRASAEPAELGAQDVVFLALKAHDIGPMLERVAPLLGPHTSVVPAINGLPWWYFHGVGGANEGRVVRALDPAGTMFAALDPDRLLGCVVHVAAEVRSPGTVHHTGGRRLILGEPRGGSTARLERVAALLAQAGFEAEATSDIRLAVWTKLVGNLSFNPVAALTGYRMDQLCADEGVVEVIRASMLEAMAVAEHLGVRIPMTPEARIDLARQLGAARISMMQDLEAGRRLELGPIVEAVMELAQDAGLAMPVTRHVHALTRARARSAGIAQP